MQALYVGRVIIGFDIDGELYPVHQFVHSNTSNADISGTSRPYIQQASLPVHYSVRTASSAAGSMDAICSSVISEGGSQLSDTPGRQFSVANAIATSLSGTSVRQHALTIQCQQTLNSIRQNTLVLPQNIVAMSDQACLIEIFRNATFSGPLSYSAGNALSTVYSSVTTGVTITGGTLIDSFYTSANSATTRNTQGITLNGKAILCYSHLLGVADTLTVCYSRLSGATNFWSSIGWREIR